MANFNLVGDTMHALHPARRGYRGELLRIAADMSGKRYNVLIDGHADMGGIDDGFIGEFVQDIVAQFQFIHDPPPER